VQPIDQDQFRLPLYPEPQDPAELGLELRLGWKQNDPTIAADAKAFWEENGMLPDDVSIDERAAEIVLAAYAADRLVAVSTAAIEEVPPLRCKMAVYRCAVAPDYRGQYVSVMISAHSLKVLEAWSLASPDEDVMGMLAVMENEKYRRKTHPHRAAETRLSLVFFNAKGQKVIVGWFDHARV
jgi:hypothetical protein